MTDHPVDPPPHAGPYPHQPQMPPGPPGYPPAGPVYSPPPWGGDQGKRRPRARWLISGAIALVVLAVAVVLVVVLLGRGSNSAPSAQPTVTPSGLDFLLLSATDVNTVMGVTDMTGSAIARTMSTNDSTLTNPACLGVFWIAEAPVYQSSGFTGARSQWLFDLDTTLTMAHSVNQAAVSFPSADKARAFLATAADTAKACAGQSVGETSKQHLQPYQRAIGNPIISDTKIIQGVTPTGDPPCQHVMETVSNVVLDVYACSTQLTDQGTRIADQMAAKAKTGS